MHEARLRVPAKGLILATVPLVFHLLFLVALFQIDRQRTKDQAAELRLQDLTNVSNQLLTLLLDIETGVRGYQLTGDREFAEPFDRAMREVPPRLERMRDLGAGDFAQIAASAGAILGYHTTNIEMMNEGRQEDAVARTASGMGKRMMDEFRVRIDAELARTENEERARRAASRRARNFLVGFILAGALVSVILAFGLARFFSRSVTRRLVTVVENASRLESGRPLMPPLPPGDEISQLDSAFHRMARSLTDRERRLREANAELEAFSYSVSHDLRAPIRAIDGYARMLHDDYAGRLEGDGIRFLGTIRSEAVRMGKLIDDLLAFSRISRQSIQREVIDLEGMVRQAFEESMRLEPGRDATLVTEPVPAALGDRAMVFQLVWNLVSNALKYSRPREKARIEFGAERTEAETVYSLRDNGVGFDMRYHDKLFGVFQRLHGNDEFEGTGVGLAIVQRVAHRHGGRVWAEGKPGEGARFCFTLPGRNEGMNAAA
ncbi:MAG TPA: ATP-binding protein [Thermoanaerobaculia bacterium]|nr:ATP-binding protein [Thermoanaerobaculia bacterium]